MRGSEAITVTPKAEKDWQGDPAGVPGAPYVLEGCALWPVMRPDDGSIIPSVLDVYIPEGTLDAEDTVTARGHDDWKIDGSADGRYISKGGVDKGLIVRIKRVL